MVILSSVIITHGRFSWGGAALLQKKTVMDAQFSSWLVKHQKMFKLIVIVKNMI